MICEFRVTPISLILFSTCNISNYPAKKGFVLEDVSYEGIEGEIFYSKEMEQLPRIDNCRLESKIVFPNRQFSNNFSKIIFSNNCSQQTKIRTYIIIKWV